MTAGGGPARGHDTGLAEARERMLTLVRGRVADARVVAAVAAVPREHFVPAALARSAYDDRPLPIGEGQTISQPLMVALMAEAAAPGAASRVLDVGTGSGYQAAVLSRLAAEVVTVERLPALLGRARSALAASGCLTVRAYGAGETLGRPEDAPYDAIVVAAGAPHVPRALIDQLAPGGRLVVPVGSLRAQELVRVTRTPHGVELVRLGPCAFVPLIGVGAWRDDGGGDVSGRSKVS